MGDINYLTTGVAGQTQRNLRLGAGAASVGMREYQPRLYQQV
jgi:hypothetical protein